jgi:hypothetical protein
MEHHMSRLTQDEVRDVRRAMMKLNAQAWGVSMGLIFGIGLFVATIILVLKSGENVGQHLVLLANYFPGYRVTTAGAFIGFVYAFVLGYGVGRIIGTVYNMFAGMRR